MNNNLSLWQKLQLALSQEPKTDDEIRYIYRNLVRPDIPVNVLWDAERGAKIRYRSVDPRDYSLNDLRKVAVFNRGIGIDQTDADKAIITPTGQMMDRLYEDRLVVPDKRDMTNLWGK